MKMNNKETKTLITQIKSVDKTTFMSKNGVETVIVLVKTTDGTFTNYLNIWKVQNINLDDVQEGDSIEIIYNVYHDTKKNKDYKNFITIKLLSAN